MDHQQKVARPGLIISGPAATGKTANREALRRHFGLTHVDDSGDWKSGRPIPADTLVLTQEDDPRAIPIAVALAALFDLRPRGAVSYSKQRPAWLDGAVGADEC